MSSQTTTKRWSARRVATTSFGLVYLLAAAAGLVLAHRPALPRPVALPVDPRECAAFGVAGLLAVAASRSARTAVVTAVLGLLGVVATFAVMGALGLGATG